MSTKETLPSFRWRVSYVRPFCSDERTLNWLLRIAFSCHSSFNLSANDEHVGARLCNGNRNIPSLIGGGHVFRTPVDMTGEQSFVLHDSEYMSNKTAANIRPSLSNSINSEIQLSSHKASAR